MALGTAPTGNETVTRQGAERTEGGGCTPWAVPVCDGQPRPEQEHPLLCCARAIEPACVPVNAHSPV